MNTLFDKIWDAHVVQQVSDDPYTIIYRQALLPRSNQPAGFPRHEGKRTQMFQTRPYHLYAGPQHAHPRSGQTD